MDVDPFGIQLQLLHGNQGDHGESFVDFEQVHLLKVPAGTLHQCIDSTDRSGGEQVRLGGVAAVTMYDGQRLQTADTSLALTHQHQRRSTVRNRAGVGRGDGAILAKGRAQGANLGRVCPGRLFVLADANLAVAGFDRDRSDFAVKHSAVDRLAGPLQ